VAALVISGWVVNTAWAADPPAGTAAAKPFPIVDNVYITVAGTTLVGNKRYPAIAGDFEVTFAKLAGMKADRVLSGHPEMTDVLGRQQRRQAGDADAFVDPTLLPTLGSRFSPALRAAA